MAKKDRNYWLERTARNLDKADIDEDKIIKRLQHFYNKTYREIEKDIFTLFGRYAEDNNLTYEEAIKLLTSDEYTEFRADVGTYIRLINNEMLDKEVRERLKLEYETMAMKTRISRLEELQFRVSAHIDDLFIFTHKEVAMLLIRSVTNSYKAFHGLRDKPSLRDKKLDDILKVPWDGANFSDKVWYNRDKLAGIANFEIRKGIMQGKSSKAITKAIGERMEGSQFAIERVVRTESKYARNEARAQAYTDMGYKYYEFSAHTEGKSSERTCKKCRELDGEIYRLDKRVPEKNIPPMHQF